MPRRSQPVDLVRRSPRQQRAQETVEIVLEATARILQRKGRAALNTNHIAELAGISVGTLYQYFPNKEAILVAIARRELACDQECVIKAMSEPSKDGQAGLVRQAIRALIAAVGRRRQVRQAAIDALVSEGFGNELAQSVQRIAQMIGAASNRFLPNRPDPVSPTSLFVITRAVSGVLRAASQEQSPLLGTQEFEDELVKLVQTYFAEPGAESSGAR